MPGIAEKASYYLRSREASPMSGGRAAQLLLLNSCFGYVWKGGRNAGSLQVCGVTHHTPRPLKGAFMDIVRVNGRL